MLPRRRHLEAIEEKLGHHPVVAIIGARQVGKTTLARQLAERWQGPVTVFDLEDPGDLARLNEPKLALEPLEGLVVIDEIQSRPDLFPLLRVLVDRPENGARFLVLGSAAPELLQQSSESLAGRILYHPLHGLNLDEVGSDTLGDLWLRGGFPRSTLAASLSESVAWRRGFVQTFLERDLPNLGVKVPPPMLRRMWSMLAHYHGQVWNASELARAFGVSSQTVRRYLDLLTATFVVRQLPPWYENLGKRQVKSPKIYIADSGMLHTLLEAPTREDLERHPKIGASWEGFALNEVMTRLGARAEECYFWAAHTGGELDLLVVRGLERRGFEFKRTDSPRSTKSMHAALKNLRLDRIDVIHPGSITFPITEHLRAVSLARIEEDIEPLAGL
ncbi:MAG: ATP-binding protein [Acidobacteriota bacterium]